MKQAKDMPKILSILKNAIAEIESGYQPEFLVFMYPRKDEPIVDHVCGYQQDDFRKAKFLVQNLETLTERIQKASVLQQMGIDESEFENAISKLSEDMERLVKRTFENMKKDPDIKDTSQAKSMLDELIRQAGTRDN